MLVVSYILGLREPLMVYIQHSIERASQRSVGLNLIKFLRF